MKKIVVLFVNYFSKNEIHKKINEIKTHNRNAEIFVVDNSGEYSKLVDEYILFPKENLGYAGGNNLIINSPILKSTDWILICNPDLTQIKWDYVFKSILTSEKKIISFRGNNKKFNQFYWNLIKRYFNTNVPSVYGCFFAIKSDIFNSINGFNKEYFMYGEEHELSFRLLAQNYTIHEDLNECYYRKNDQNFKKHDWKLKLKIINNLFTICLNINGFSKLKILIVRYVYDLFFIVKNFKFHLVPFLLYTYSLSINKQKLNGLRNYVIQSRR